MEAFEPNPSHVDRSELSQEEFIRYSRHLAMPEFNIDSQKKLKNARVLVVGAGGLGAPLLLYLAAAGVGTLGIVDFDTVDVSNLQRQILYGMSDVGKPKATCAKKRLLELNPHINVNIYPVALQSDNAFEIIKDYDIVADGTDNFPTRYLVNDACVLLGKINVFASIFRFEGQVAVFNAPTKDGQRSPNYRDLFPAPPPPGLVPNCAEGGVLGVLPGIIGSLQANEIIKIIAGIGKPLIGELLLLDVARFKSRTLKIPKNPATSITELIDYEEFCSPVSHPQTEAISQVSPTELRERLQSGETFQLIDVREPWEHEIVALPSKLIPKEKLLSESSLIPRHIPVIIYCRSGVRSSDVIRILQQDHGFENLYNLEGGILGWVEQIDPTLPKY